MSGFIGKHNNKLEYNMSRYESLSDEDKLLVDNVIKHNNRPGNSMEGIETIEDKRKYVLSHHSIESLRQKAQEAASMSTGVNTADTVVDTDELTRLHLLQKERNPNKGCSIT